MYVVSRQVLRVVNSLFTPTKCPTLAICELGPIVATVKICGLRPIAATYMQFSVLLFILLVCVSSSYCQFGTVHCSYT